MKNFLLHIKCADIFNLSVLQHLINKMIPILNFEHKIGEIKEA
jgi:hypothetical protein